MVNVIATRAFLCLNFLRNLPIHIKGDLIAPTTLDTHGVPAFIADGYYKFVFRHCAVLIDLAEPFGIQTAPINNLNLRCDRVLYETGINESLGRRYVNICHYILTKPKLRLNEVVVPDNRCTRFRQSFQQMTTGTKSGSVLFAISEIVNSGQPIFGMQNDQTVIIGHYTSFYARQCQPACVRIHPENGPS